MEKRTTAEELVDAMFDKALSQGEKLAIYGVTNLVRKPKDETVPGEPIANAAWPSRGEAAAEASASVAAAI